MDAKTFADELQKINEDAWDKVRDLVERAQKEEGLEWDTSEKVSFYDESCVENVVNSLSLLGAWAHDRLRGMTRLNKKSLSKKIRKALGYTYP